MSEPAIDIKISLDENDRPREIIIRKIIEENGYIVAYGLNHSGEWVRWIGIGRPSDDCRLPLSTKEFEWAPEDCTTGRWKSV